MRIWNLFEQSGHFKDVEAEMGYDGVDVDCVKTDHTDYVMDLLAEMDKWEKGEKSIFDEIKKDDFVFSFFPCIRFENQANMLIQGFRNPDIYKPMVDRLDISREREREKYMVWILLPFLRNYDGKGCEMRDRESVFDRTLFDKILSIES